MQDLNISFIQSTIKWEDRNTNLEHYSSLINKIDTATDIILLPEMFPTGFSMDVSKLAEKMDGVTINWMTKMAFSMKASIIGSVIISEGDRFYNRLLLVHPDGSIQTYDKRHLFRMAHEDQTYTPSTNYIVVDIKGWKVRPFVCYDLRFPVWARNKYINGVWEYDLAIFIANWPASRTIPWQTLPIARAIENQSYVATLNRIGKDGKGLDYNGDSQLIDSYGEVITRMENNEQVITRTISKSKLDKHRKDFPVGLDADHFELKE